MDPGGLAGWRRRAAASGAAAAAVKRNEKKFESSGEKRRRNDESQNKNKHELGFRCGTGSERRSGACTRGTVTSWRGRDVPKSRTRWRFHGSADGRAD